MRLLSIQIHFGQLEFPREIYVGTRSDGREKKYVGKIVLSNPFFSEHYQLTSCILNTWDNNNH